MGSEMCIRDSTSPDDRVESGTEMKILGFIFGEKPSVSMHLKYTISKYNRAVWALTHLKRAGLSQATLVSVYCTLLRPVIEFCNVIYHSMLTEDQNIEIERLQKMSLRVIFGFNLSYTELLKRANIVTLEDRRKEAFLKFSRSCIKNERYCEWFPLNNQNNNDVNLRRMKRYLSLIHI